MPSPRPPSAPREGELELSRPYSASEDDPLDYPGGAPVTGEGYVVGFWLGGGTLQIEDQSDGAGSLVFEADFSVAAAAYNALPVEQWVPFKEGARIITGAGTTCRLRFRRGPITDQPVNP